MPTNSKTFSGLKRDSYERVRQQLSSKRWSLPSGDSGYLRGNGLMADWDYNEKDEALSIRIRSVAKGETYASTFGSIETVVKLSSA